MEKQVENQENNQAECYVISVESRKGGVGKTTAALNLARMLVQSEDYEVVLFDFDILGTEIASIEESLLQLRMWQKYIYMIEDPSQKPEKLNLVRLFENYMVGKTVPDIKWDKEENESILLKRGKINIFCSRLNRAGDGKKSVYGPATLFDEMHSEWFLSMIKELVRRARSSLDLKKKNLVVIIDNAPGFSGLEPSVDDWLTDIGPQFGKFLFVCTLDTQDFKGCLTAIDALHNIYCEKLGIAEYFLNCKTKKEAAKPDFSKKRAKQFFFRLIESAPEKYKCENCDKMAPFSVDLRECPVADFCFYKQKKKINNFGKECRGNPSRYLGLIVNRVPKMVLDESYRFKLEDIVKQKGIDNGLNKLEFLARKHWIPYRDEWSYQFMVDLLKKKTDADIEQEKKLLLSPESLMSKLKECKNAIEGKSLMEASLKVESEYDKIFLDFFNQSNNSQLSDLRRFWSDDFFILFSKRRLFELAIDFFKPTDPFENPKALAKVVISNIFEKISEVTEYSVLEEAAEILGKDINRDMLNIVTDIKGAPIAVRLSEELDIVQVLSLNMALLKNLKFNEKKVRSLALILYTMQCIIILKAESEGGFDIKKDLKDTAYWKKQISDDVELNAAVKKTILNKNVLGEIELLEIKDKEDQLIELYKAVVGIKIRLLDSFKDFEFLVNCFKVILRHKQLTTQLIERLSEVAREVVVEKNTLHQEGLEILLELGLPEEGEMEEPEAKPDKKEEPDPVHVLMNRDEMKDFSKVLGLILGKNRWQMLK